jgi:hypothetical protein
MAGMTQRSFQKLPVEAVLTWTVKAAAPIFFRLVLLMFLMAFLAWPYSYMKAAYGRARGIGGDLAFILRCYGQRLLKRAPRNKAVQLLLEHIIRMQLWGSLLKRLRPRRDWAGVAGRPATPSDRR